MNDAVLAHAAQLRRNRQADIAQAMADVDRGNARLKAANAERIAARLQIVSAKQRLATLIEHGEQHVYHDQLITALPTGGVRIETVRPVPLL